MNNLIKFLILIQILLFYSCSSKENKNLDSLTLSYLNDNKNSIIFGKIDIQSILDKSSYKEIPKAGVLIFEELKKFQAALDLNEKISFVVEGPFINNNPNRVILFSKIKNEDSLKSKILAMGYTLKSDGKMQYLQQEEVSVGFKENLFVLITKKGQYDSKKVLSNIFDACNNEPITGKIENILKQKSDINIGFHYKNIYDLSKNQNLNKDKLNELNRLIEDSYSSLQCMFEKGFAQINIQNFLSDALLKRLFLSKDNSGEILKKLGTGDVNSGLSLVIDTDKLQSLFDDFAPNTIDDFTNDNFIFGGLISKFGEKPISGLWNGKLSIVQFGETKSDGFVPNFNFYFGLGNNGKSIAEILKSYLPGAKINNDGTLNFNGMKLTLNDNEIYGSTSINDKSSLNFPNFAKGFGTNGIQFFLDFEKIEPKKLSLDDDMKFIYALKNIRFDLDNEKGKIVLVGKNPNQNILKQIIDVYLDDLKDKISQIN